MTRDLTPDPPGFRVDDLIVELAPRRVRRAGTLIRLQALSFDLLVALARAAPNVVSFEQLSERVWPGLVITPETIVQRVKLVRGALGDDPQAPRYIEGVRGRGYRMIAAVHPLTELPPPPRTVESLGVSADIAATNAPFARWGLFGWIAGALIIVALLAVSWAMVRQPGASRPVERASSAAAAAVIHSLAVLPLETCPATKSRSTLPTG
ncbi:MAG TPA: winged helix-turn-helix domain-containing protein [Steroidobacteraceae bacterium]|nr:winged helix-turn-helix domain-containing protein [Steroidobacteraceae bacterium]